MALRLKDPEVLSQFCWSHFEILNFKKLTICLSNYHGKHIFMVKYDGQSLQLLLVNSGYNKVDKKSDDDTTKLVFYGWLQV